MVGEKEHRKISRKFGAKKNIAPFPATPWQWTLSLSPGAGWTLSLSLKSIVYLFTPQNRKRGVDWGQ